MNKTVNTGAISSRILAEMLSGPEALLIFSDLISLSMPSVEKAISGAKGNVELIH